jgi:hypothetical protein
MNVTTVLENLVNGNLATAKRQAKQVSYRDLLFFAQENYGWPLAEATAAAMYLKNHYNFEEYCTEKARIEYARKNPR